jgi:hypothetical protein
MKGLVLSFWAILLCSFVFAQPEEKNQGVCFGLVTESVGGQVVEYANITVFAVKDSVLITGTITGSDGRFLLTDLPFEALWIEVEYLGFAKFSSDIFSLDLKVPYKEFDKIVITPAANILQEVSVESEMKHVEYQIDKKVVNPTKDILAAGGTAADVLKNVPSVQTDLDGNVSIRGNSGFKLLIDGKPSIIQGSDGLKQIPAEAIERIEVITNPSARYDADGVAGIVNVIMKKDKRDGINGLVSLSGGKILDTYNTSDNFNFNIRKKNFNFFIGADCRFYGHPGSGITTQLSGLDSQTELVTDFKSQWTNNTYNVRLGADINISPKDLLTVSGNIGSWQYGYQYDSFNSFKYLTGASVITAYTYDQSSFMDFVNNFYGGNLNYTHSFAKEGHELNIAATYNSSLYTRVVNYLVGYSNEFLIENEVTNFGNLTDEVEELSSGNLEMNYKNSIFGGNLEAGYKADISGSDALYDFYNITTSNGETMVIDPSRSNPLNMKENIQSLYSTFSGELLKFGYKLGLRMESTDRKFTKTLTGFQFGNEELSLFPSVHISKSINDKNQMFISYSRRIQRPEPWFLDPQITFTSLYNIRMGNPELKSEFTDSYELGYSLINGMNYFSLEAFCRKSNNKITPVLYLSDTSNALTINTFGNIDHDFSTGLETMLNIKLFKAISLSTGGSVFYYALTGMFEGTQINKKMFNYNAWLNSSYTLRKTATTFQVSAYFTGPQIELNTTSGHFFTLSAAVKQNFLKNKMSLSLGCDHLVKSKYWISTTSYDGFISDARFLISGLRLKVSLTYRINDYKPRRDNTNQNNEGGGMQMM